MASKKAKPAARNKPKTAPKKYVKAAPKKKTGPAKKGSASKSAPAKGASAKKAAAAHAKAAPTKAGSKPGKAPQSPVKGVLAKAKARVAKVFAPAPASTANAKLPKSLAKTDGKVAAPVSESKTEVTPMFSAPPKRADGWLGPLPDKALPRATRLPPEAELLTKREMEQVLTVGQRGAAGEGSLKGRLVVYQGFPYLEVIGRDKRELWFMLQGPDQEVLPAYGDHRVSVSGLIRRNHAYGGLVDVRKYSAKKPDVEVLEEPAAVEVVEENKLRLLSPGEVSTLSSPGMAVGVKGFATLRGRLEMSGEEFYLVVSNGGTRQQVAFTLEGKATKGLKKYVGEIMVASGIIEKSTGCGGKIHAEIAEARAPEYPPVARTGIDIVKVDGVSNQPKNIDVKLNHGLLVKLPEKQGYVWAIEPQTAKRVSLREVGVSHEGGNPVREFFFTPRNPGPQEIDFFLAKVHNPMQTSKTFKVIANVKVPDTLTA